MNEILNRARVYSKERFEISWDPRYSYHNWNHTLEVASNSVWIGKKEGLTPDELVMVEIAALFHDLGHLTGYKNHEARSIMEVSDFLASCGMDAAQGRLVENAIMATKVPQSPLNTISRVLCDADLMYLSGDEFFKQAEQLRLEWWSSDRTHLDPEAFFRFSLDFLTAHRFHTEYGKRVLEQAKLKNLALLEQKLQDGSFNQHN